MKPNEAKIGDRVLAPATIYQINDWYNSPLVELDSRIWVNWDAIELASEMLSRSEIAKKLAVVYHGCKTASSIATVHYCASVLGVHDIFDARIEELRIEELRKGKENGKY